jgi:ribosomal protein S18 acetylase RimI-like enzyme
MKIVQVSTPKELKKFIRLPYRLYRGHPHWVPPLRGEVRAQFDINKNPFLEHCDYQLFLLLDGSRIVGRIAAFIDSVANTYWNEPVGLFGYYECPDDLQASALLLDSAREWLKARGMRSMRGPWSFVSQEWGAVVEGFEPPPVIMAPFNPPDYIDHFNIYGFHKIKDLLVYVIDARENYRIPERILTLTDRVSEKYGIRTRPLDIHQYDREVASFLDLSNKSLADNWGYAPVTPAEAAAMAKDLKSVLHPKAVIFAEDREGRAVGFGLALPDVNQLLKGINGRLLPFGWFKLLTGLPKLTHYRMFALGVIPEYHGKAIDSLIYRALYESIFSPDLRMEINYVLEDNAPMNNAIIKLGARPLRRYRIFEIAF